MPKDPQELLARWASDEILDPYGPVLDKDSNSQSSASPVDYLGNITDAAGGEDLDGPFAMARTLPLTTDELTASTPAKRPVAPVEPESEKKPQTTELPPATIAAAKPTPPQDNEPAPVDSHQETAETNPPVAHQVQLPREPAAKRGGGSLMVLGQILAYIGVLSLTIGSTFVLWGFFGDKPHYTPMGWLVLTAGQMLLFLGIVTIVSGGIEQTTSTVDIQFTALNEQILRIEQAVHSQAATSPAATSSSNRDDSAPGVAA
ncbi:hypothetical protein CA54_38880 [Symmachiella macrocystis]|uniref:Uncharacterized protein n=1 Tax=Symmachiella macrocystis TaxID=2527985 RepID=A0A5C6BAH4_9PLAN|nr:hypothetical protein [Symmachiella macrocystis]TWU08652.1 hypothetical protein CA54_38880 [Symmachiella macrocystis]